MPDAFCKFEKDNDGVLRLPVADVTIALGDQLKMVAGVVTPVTSVNDFDVFVGVAAERRTSGDGTTTMLVLLGGDGKVFRVGLSSATTWVVGQGFKWAASGSFTKADDKTMAIAVETVTTSTGHALVKFRMTGDLAASLAGITNDVAPTELTIAGGIVTRTRAFHTIDTQADAAADDLDTISGGTIGDRIVIIAENGARDVVVKNGTGNIVAPADRTLDNAGDTWSGIFDGTNWLETGFVNNGA
jgi:hypothetical protein